MDQLYLAEYQGPAGWSGGQGVWPLCCARVVEADSDLAMAADVGQLQSHQQSGERQEVGDESLLAYTLALIEPRAPDSLILPTASACGAESLVDSLLPRS